MVALLFFFRHLAQADAVLQFRDRDQAVEQPRAVVALHRPFLAGAVNLEFAGNGLDQVLQRDQTQHFAVFVDDKGDLAAGAAEVLQQLHAGHAFRHEHGWLHHCQQVGLLAAQPARQQLARADHADDVVHAAAHDRKARVVGFFDAVQVFIERLFHVQVHDIAARHHQRCQLAVVQPEHVAHHGVLVLFDHAGFGTLDQQRVDFFLGHARAAVDLGAEQPQHQPR
ncbi:hypothetical protein D3C72_985590 [compost metagenome]